jgi:hypothetical protein
MFTFAEAAIVDTVYRLPTKENKLSFFVSVCSKQKEVCHFRFSVCSKKTEVDVLC